MCLKIRIFWKKAVKIAAASETPPPNPSWSPAAGLYPQTPALLLPATVTALSRVRNITSADVLHLLLRLFFTSDSAVLLMGGAKIFSGAGYPSYATVDKAFYSVNFTQLRRHYSCTIPLSTFRLQLHWVSVSTICCDGDVPIGYMRRNCIRHQYTTV